ncbi:MAG: endolytic transglycosylase MltG, partial [Bacilli bacterium]
SITFPEGKNFRYIASTIAAKTNNTEKEVYDLIKDESYLNEIINEHWFLTDDIKNNDIYYSLEGYLFPDTYIIENKDVDVKDIFETMLDQTDKILSKYKSDILENNYSIHELMTMASIIEMEGVSDEDRSTMAGVFYNRLEINMHFGSCATACYASKFDGVCKPANVQTKYNSPYNTYLPSTAGKLTPGPIGLPGEKSIKAILYPEENDFLFFVSDKNGKTYFSKTNTEHEANKTKIRNDGNWIE